MKTWKGELEGSFKVILNNCKEVSVKRNIDILGKDRCRVLARDPEERCLAINFGSYVLYDLEIYISEKMISWWEFAGPQMVQIIFQDVSCSHASLLDEPQYEFIKDSSYIQIPCNFFNYLAHSKRLGEEIIILQR